MLIDPEVADRLVDRRIAGPQQAGDGEGQHEQDRPGHTAEGQPSLQRGRLRRRSRARQCPVLSHRHASSVLRLLVVVPG
jgi:hypothetical protein